MTPELNAGNMERHIASALSGFVNELRLVDLSHYISYIQLDKHSCLADIINEASKLYFSPGFLHFENVSATTADWGTEASVSLNISLNGMLARSFVNIMIFDRHATVKLVHTSPHLDNSTRKELEEFCCRELAENYLGRRHLSQIIDQTVRQREPYRVGDGFCI